MFRVDELSAFHTLTGQRLQYRRVLALIFLSDRLEFYLYAQNIVYVRILLDQLGSLTKLEL